MSVLVKNTSQHAEFVDVVQPSTGAVDTITVQPGGRVSLPSGWRVKDTGVNRPHLAVTGNDTPASPLR